MSAPSPMATQPASHTPGPWANNGIDLIDGGPRFGAHLFTTQAGEPIGDEEMYANARLISKAPDLLKALVRQVGACFDPDCPMCAEHQALIDFIRAAQVQA